MYMNICKQLFKTLMVLTTLMYCKNGYTTEFNLTDFDINGRLASCSVNLENGLILKTKDNIVQYHGANCYDFQTLLDKAMNNDNNEIIVPDNENLVVKNTDGINHFNYTIADKYNKKPEGSEYLDFIIKGNNINIIIPLGVTVHQKDVIFKVYSNDKINNSEINLIIRGKMDNTSEGYNYSDSLFNFYNKANVLIGATAEINFNNLKHNPIFQLTTSDSNVILYPGCIIKQCENEFNEDEEEQQFLNIIQSKGTLYLNKYVDEYATTKDYENIAGTVSKNINIVFPNSTSSDSFDTDTENNYLNHKMFQNLYWIGDIHGVDGNTNGTWQTADYTKHFTEYDSFLYKKN